MAPEVMKNGTYTKSVDIWSIGIIMHIILTGGKHPLYDKYNGETHEDLKKNLL
jgi:serine/threonine protein kinase